MVERKSESGAVDNGGCICVLVLNSERLTGSFSEGDPGAVIRFRMPNKNVDVSVGYGDHLSLTSFIFPYLLSNLS